MQFSKVEVVANNNIKCLSCRDEPTKIWENQFRKSWWLTGSPFGATIWGYKLNGIRKSS